MNIKKYELTSLFYAHINIDKCKELINETFKSFNDESIKVHSIQEIGRYDAYNKKLGLDKAKNIKVNMITCIYECPSEKVLLVVNKFKKTTDILKSINIRENNYLIPKVIDYKHPIEIKKYVFESLRIMPKQLTNFTKKKQRMLAMNIKRARILGLMNK